ncbi:MAG: cation:proton antiporter, partial [Acidobacteriota bacterium]|nr:cation:proton antiporter [Acidobacteriota bacterium]
MSLIEALLLLLVLSRVLGEIAGRFGQPAMIGEIGAGVLLGPSVLHYIQFTPEIRAIADLGVLLLVFRVGMEMDMDALWVSVRGRGAWVSAAGFVVPLVLGILVGEAFGLDQTRAIFIGLCVAITALPVSVRILLDLGKLQTEIGQKIVSAAVANDVLSLLVLGVILNVKGGNGTQKMLFISMALALCKALVFMIVIVIAARMAKRYSIGRFSRPGTRLDRFLRKLRGKESIFAIALVLVIAFASFSEVLGLDFVVGAFFGSMLLSHQVLGRRNFDEIQKTASDVTMGFLGPIFFAAIGLEFDASTLRSWRLVLAILAVSFAGKIFGGYLGGRFARLRSDESWALGIG